MDCNYCNFDCRYAGDRYGCPYYEDNSKDCNECENYCDCNKCVSYKEGRVESSSEQEQTLQNVYSTP